MKFKQVVYKKNLRRGRFSLDSWHVRNSSVAVSRIMSQCIIVRAEMNFMRGAIDYEAISWRFREVPEGEVMPTYRWVYDDDTGELYCEEVGREDAA